MDKFFQVFFLLGLIFIYLISAFILRPFRKHRKRKLSTISLKISFLSFLAVFFVFIYLLLFKPRGAVQDPLLYDSIFNIHFIIFATATIVPNVGVMMRQRMKKHRVEYNLIFTLINLIYIFYFLYMLSSGKWTVL